MKIYSSVQEYGKALTVAYTANEDMFAVGVCGCFGFCFMGVGKADT